MGKKRILSIIMIFILSISIILCDFKKAEASVGTVLTGLGVLVPVVIAVESSDNYQNWYANEYQPKYQEFIHDLFKAAGLSTTAADIIAKLGGDPIANVIQWLANKDNVDPNTITQDQAEEALYDMCGDCTINSGDDTFIFSGDLKNYTQYLINQYIANSGYQYTYSSDMRLTISSFGNGVFYNRLKDFIEDKQNDYYCFIWSRNGFYVLCVPKTNTVGVLYNHYRIDSMKVDRTLQF